MDENTLEAIDAKLEEQQICGIKHCPRCGHKLDGKPDWLCLPAGVKFDPTDQELIEHLEAKVEAEDIKSHPLIDEFIPTIEGEDGICYTHPEKFPGVTRDGLIRHFFHRPSKAYTTGTRKRRKIQTECDLRGGETRWHKTGKTRPIMANGKQKGCKKILVLYTNFGKNRKPEKTNWVMHQYHLGLNEEEREGELVVSKIFYQTQPRQCNWSDRSQAIGGGIIDLSGRRDSGSESVSSKGMTVVQRNDMASGGGLAPPVSSFICLESPQLKSNHFSFAEFSQGFNEVGIVEASIPRDPPTSRTCEERPHDHVAHNHRHRHQMGASSTFHVSRPSHQISTIISPPPLYQPSIVLDPDSFNLSQILLQNENFQELTNGEERQQKHKRERGRSASGLEELIRGCTSSTIKQESSSTTTRQETEWMKVSSFWPDTDNPNHHGVWPNPDASQLKITEQSMSMEKEKREEKGCPLDDQLMENQ